MQKIVISAGVAVIAVIGLFSYANAASPTIHLDDEQTVLIKQQVDSGKARPVGKSGYYAIKVKDLKAAEINGNIEIYPIASYRKTLAVNDPLEPQGYMTLLGASTFWDNAPDASGETVAIIDGGFALNHEDLTNRWATNANEQGTTVDEGPAPNCTSRELTLDKSCNNLDDDANGYIDDWRGWDFSEDDNDPMVGTTNPTADGVDHATILAGLVGASGNNSLGGASLNWQSKIMPLQIFTDDGEATTLQLADALSYAIDQHVSVINLSLGSTVGDPAIDTLLEQARDDGIIVVASAGNCGGEYYAYNGCDYEGQLMYPANTDYTIAVAATDLDDAQATFSSRGDQVDVTAPGSGMLITADYLSGNSTSAYTDQSEIYGTSFSAPIVSSLMASLKAEWPGATFDDLRSAIIDSAYKTSGMNGANFTTRYGFGRIRPVNALDIASKCRNTTVVSDINCDNYVNLLDLSLLASQWQQNYTGRTDENHSGKVDLLDLSLLASQWGATK